LTSLVLVGGALFSAGGVGGRDDPSKQHPGKEWVQGILLDVPVG